mmetsp:Transcript_20804/g.29085  ORF Transcript_20804/g.29085 Transcript_20804/m.29085 type:complete len:358 (-) Transcript_20804:141-1214(-)|eukprot:CAMPEP_0184484096 /NCGR_PEP_ID=MMETSP0113_2-20130426/5812_1 /TAXON_ID=91329 /ORGANISM="Norrisiella sphaerica, Strain BC52" /LENGTH=357 /DNA_ID=CAMNT_0026864907 /DNA_START=83 /DNA_END=1156 /DNA_ORIENTATION=+
MSNTTSIKLEAFLDKYTVKDLIPGERKLIHVESKTTVEDVLKLLNKHKILSVPVFDKSSEHEKKNGMLGSYLGLITMADIVQGLAFNPWFEKYTLGFDPTKKLFVDDMERLVKYSVLQSPISELIGMSQETKDTWIFDETSSLNTVAKCFSQGAHRALVTREKGGPTLLSQSDCARFLARKLEYETALGSDIGKLLEQPLSKVGLFMKGVKVISIDGNALALMGFQKLLQWKGYKDWQLASLPIVDSKQGGKLIGNLSESDLRGITSKNLCDILLPLKEYLTKMNGEIRAPITVTSQTTFLEALEKVVLEKVHRAWIVDDKNVPVGIFSLSDIMAPFTNFSWIHSKNADGQFESKGK